MPTRYAMSPEELQLALAQLRQDPTLESVARATEAVVQDLQAHQVELEVQNEELREMHRALESSRNRFADLFDFAPVGYVTFDRNGVVVEANLTACALLGLDRGRLVGKPFAAISRVVDPRAFREHLEQVFGDSARAGYDAVFEAKRGLPVALELNSVRSFDAHGRALEQCRTTMTDVTQRKRDHAMLRLLADSSARLSSSLDYGLAIASVAELAVPTLADACIFDVVDEDGRLHRLPIASSEPTVQALVALLERPLLMPGAGSPQARAMEQRQPLLLVDAASVAAVPAELAHACGAPSSALLVPLVTRDTCLGVLTLLMLGSGRVSSDADRLVAEDLARRVAMAVDNARLFGEAQRAIRAREDVLSTVSHDMRNSLSSMVLDVALLQSTAPAEERRRDHRRIETLRRGAEQMKRLTDDLADLASIETGQLAIDRGAWGIDEILDEAMETLGSLARAKGQALTLRPLGDATRAACDRGRVLQVLANLVGNAIKYTPEGGHIEIEAQRVGSAVRLCVSDDGPGIDAQSMKHLFDRYWRVEKRSASGKRGLGLGLDICKGLVESHGGKIWVESGEPSGSRFYFTLPVSHATPSTSRDDQPTVLVVDDSDVVRRGLVEVLEQRGCNVLSAADGVEALVLLGESLELDLVLVDLEMPHMNGRELVERLVTNETLRRVPIVFMSGGRMADGEAEDLGATAFVQKPFDVTTVLDLIPRTQSRDASP